VNIIDPSFQLISGEALTIIFPSQVKVAFEMKWNTLSTNYKHSLQVCIFS